MEQTILKNRKNSNIPIKYSELNESEFFNGT